MCGRNLGTMVVSDYAGKYLKGSIWREMPGTMRSKTIAEVEALAKGGNADARTARKLMMRQEYMKPGWDFSKIQMCPKCFDIDTKVTILRDGKEVVARVANIAVGELVKTRKDAWTKVTENDLVSGSFEAVCFSLAGLDEPLVVTPEHDVIVNEAMVSAANVTKGSLMQLGDGTLVEVERVQPYTMKDKCTLMTEDGTVVASKVWTTTSCK